MYTTFDVVLMQSPFSSINRIWRPFLDGYLWKLGRWRHMIPN